MDQNKVLVEEQNGFRKKRSCQHHIFTLLTIARGQCKMKIKKEVSNEQTNEGLFTAFVDFRKAFDVIDRSLLYYNLKQIGVGGNFIQLIQEIYSKTSSTIQINDLFTEEFVNENGVLQGNNISPSLFSLYVNNLLCELNKSPEGVRIDQETKIAALAYADDIVLLANTAKGLQHLMDVVKSWCSRWRMSVNTNKTKVVHLTETVLEHRTPSN